MSGLWVRGDSPRQVDLVEQVLEEPYQIRVARSSTKVSIVSLICDLLSFNVLPHLRQRARQLSILKRHQQGAILATTLCLLIDVYCLWTIFLRRTLDKWRSGRWTKINESRANYYYLYSFENEIWEINIGWYHELTLSLYPSYPVSVLAVLA
jgi:hypothetical protein